MPKSPSVLPAFHTNSLQRGQTMPSRRRRPSDDMLEGSPPASRQSPATPRLPHEGHRPPATSGRAARPRPIDHLLLSTMPAALRSELRAAVASIPDGARDSFAHHILRACVDGPSSSDNASLRYSVLQSVLAYSGTSKMPFVVQEAARVIRSQDSENDRIAFIELLGSMSHPLKQQLHLVRAHLDSQVDLKARCRLLGAFNRWPDLDFEVLRSLLQLAEPLLHHPRGPDWQALSEAAKAAARGRKSKGVQTPPSNAPTVPEASVIPGLTEEQLTEVLQAWPHDCYDISPTLTPTPSRAGTPVSEEQILYAHPEESVMRRRRHVATMAAFRRLKELVTFTLPGEAIKPIMHRFLDRLYRDAPFRQRFHVTEENASSAWDVWQRPKNNEDHTGPLVDNMMLSYLGPMKLPVIDFMGYIITAIGQYTDVQAKLDWASCRKMREMMLTCLVNNLALCQDMVQDRVRTDAEVKMRVCSVGITQQPLEAIAGYYPISLEHITPANLLTSLAEETFGLNSGHDEPTLEDLIFFRDHALARAEEVFITGAFIPDDDDLAEFKEQLMAYLYYDHDMGNKAAPSSLENA